MTATTDSASAATSNAEPAPPQEWKPEPRQWTWKDLFTAPMLAFKPKCMLISAGTLIALGAWGWLFQSFIWKLYSDPGERIWAYLAAAVWVAVGAVVYSLGASLVAVFMRADLLDDEFLSWREAIGQFQGRLAPALLVPLFLLALLVGVNLFLIYIPELICSLPYAGSLLYAVFYPIGYFLAIFAVLLLIAVGLSVFVFPGIIAIRKHGWFDNVVDTIEAVGTKPHVLVGSLVLTLIMMWVASSIGKGAMEYLRAPSRNNLLFDWQELPKTETRADEVRYNLFHNVDPLTHLGALSRLWLPVGFEASTIDPPVDASPYAPSHPGWQSDWDASTGSHALGSTSNRYYEWGPGLITGLWKTAIVAVLLGYCMNLLIGGGMLTYLLVREDDYWDDEDLEDLDKLAKELEEEAKRDESGAQPTTPAAGAGTATPPPPTPPAPTPPATT